MRNSKVIFATLIFQEYAEFVSKVARKLDIQVGMSSIGCDLGYLGIYAEFENDDKKEIFKKKISSAYSAKMVWVS